MHRNGLVTVLSVVTHEVDQADACRALGSSATRSLGLLGRLFDDTHLNGLSGVSLLLFLGGLDSSSLSLGLELLLTNLLLLHLVDALDENGLVLEQVTLGGEIEVMVDILGDLLGLSVFFEKSTEDSLAAHPQDLDGHTSVRGTLSLTVTVVSALSFGLVHSLDAGARVHVDGSLEDETIPMELADVLSYKQVKMAAVSILSVHKMRLKFGT